MSESPALINYPPQRTKYCRLCPVCVVTRGGKLIRFHALLMAEVHFKDGTLSGEGDYVVGQRSGPWTYYFRNGKIKPAGISERFPVTTDDA